MSADLTHRVAWYEAGADGTAREEQTVRPSAGQLWYRLLSLPVADRLALLGRFLDDADFAYRCMAMDHTGRLTHAEHRANDALARLEAIYNPPSGQHAAPPAP